MCIALACKIKATSINYHLQNQLYLHEFQLLENTFYYFNNFCYLRYLRQENKKNIA